jgi:hypothetical protein
MLGLGKLLMLPYSLPAAGIKYCFNKVIEMAETELTDDTAVKEELLLLNERYDQGEIDEAEFKRQEAPLLARYSEIRSYRKQLAEERLGGIIEEDMSERVAVIESPEELDRPA